MRKHSHCFLLVLGILLPFLNGCSSQGLGYKLVKDEEPIAAQPIPSRALPSLPTIEFDSGQHIEVALGPLIEKPNVSVVVTGECPGGWHLRKGSALSVLRGGDPEIIVLARWDQELKFLCGKEGKRENSLTLTLNPPPKNGELLSGFITRRKQGGTENFFSSRNGWTSHL